MRGRALRRPAYSPPTADAGSPSPSTARRGIIPVVLALLLALATPVAAEDPSPAELMDALMWGKGPIGGPFALTDHTGATRTEADFRGQFVLLYFGYTSCPDVCPTDLGAIAAAVDLLGEDGARVQLLFISFDPAHDTARLADYVALFHPRLLGLTGDEAAVKRMATAYKSWYRPFQLEDGTQAFEHSAFIHLVGPDGDWLGFFPPGTSAERIAEVLRARL
jgi:cytochrome oxidase Cu insertion factor (SCO1/SenC/PrrC family)